MKRWWNTCLLAGFLFLILPLKVLAAETLIPVGQIIGLQLRSPSLTVAAYDDSLGNHARAAGICIGDEILKIDGRAVSSADDIRQALADSADPLSLTLRREGRERTLTLSALQTSEGKRLGIYLRQGIAGIGTVTWLDPQTGKFGALGHGVSNGHGSLLHMQSGAAYPAQVLSVKKGLSGEPGQLKGACDTADCGILLRNTPQGVFGITTASWQGQPLPVASYSEIHTGGAMIRSTVRGNSPREYSVEILKIYPEDKSDGRNFLIRVTDPELLAATGGIVQGMSGSPIIQDGKFIGAVTHVLVNDPQAGYGIFIENMLEAAA